MKVSGLFPLRFLLPSLPRGAAQPAIVQEEPASTARIAERLVRAAGPVINYQFPPASHSHTGSHSRVSVPSCLRHSPDRGAALGRTPRLRDCECAGGWRRAGVGKPAWQGKCRAGRARAEATSGQGRRDRAIAGPLSLSAPWALTRG